MRGITAQVITMQKTRRIRIGSMREPRINMAPIIDEIRRNGHMTETIYCMMADPNNSTN